MLRSDTGLDSGCMQVIPDASDICHFRLFLVWSFIQDAQYLSFNSSSHLLALSITINLLKMLLGSLVVRKMPHTWCQRWVVLIKRTVLYSMHLLHLKMKEEQWAFVENYVSLQITKQRWPKLLFSLDGNMLKCVRCCCRGPIVCSSFLMCRPFRCSPAALSGPWAKASETRTRSRKDGKFAEPVQVHSVSSGAAACVD